jgi:hypothetical protein
MKKAMDRLRDYQDNRRLQIWPSAAYRKMAGRKSDTCGKEEMLYTTIGRLLIEHGKGKGKAIPLQAWTSSEDSRRLRLPDFKTIGT